MVQVAHSVAVAREGLCNMAKKTSPFDVNWVSMGPFAFSPSQLKKGKFVFDRGDGTIETIKMPFRFGEKGGKDNGKDDGKSGSRPPIKDVNFNMDGKPTYTRPIKKFDKSKAIKDLIGDPRNPSRARIGKGEISKVSVVPTMRGGGVVRGAGKALRGRGRKKMV